MKLLLDLGNTRLKWALANDQRWLARGAVAWDEDVPAALALAWRELAAPMRVWGASVVDGEREAQVGTVVAATFSREVAWLRTPSQACGVRNAYAQPRRLGVDRFLTMVAARRADAAPCVLAGIGTALTLDALAADGRHLGGLIAPGPRLMQQSLLGATAQVRPERPGEVHEAADNTADAVASGCWLAAVALVERFVARMAPQLGGAPHLLVHGGDAEAILPLLALPARHAADSVLHGLAAWADEQPTA
jgi:type III pantothenate kinase